MPGSILHQKLQKLLGQTFTYLSCDWRLIEVLGDSDQVVLQRTDSAVRNLQVNQYGQANRRCPETLTLAISDKELPDNFSDELLILLQGRKAGA